MTGPLNVESVEYNIAAWSNVSDKKGKYLKIKLTKKEDKGSPESDSSDAPF